MRYYESVKWVSTDEKFFWMDIAVMKAFRRLYKYITGENENGGYECICLFIDLHNNKKHAKTQFAYNTGMKNDSWSW